MVGDCAGPARHRVVGLARVGATVLQFGLGDGERLRGACDHGAVVLPGEAGGRDRGRGAGERHKVVLLGLVDAAHLNLFGPDCSKHTGVIYRTRAESGACPGLNTHSRPPWCKRPCWS